MGADVYIKFCIKKGNSSLPYSDPEGWAGATFKTWLRHCTLWNCFYYPTTRLWNSNTTLWYARLQGHPPPLLSSQLPPILPYLLPSSYQNIINLVPHVIDRTLTRPSSVRNYSKTLPVVIHHISYVATIMCCPLITHVPKYSFLFIERSGRQKFCVL